MRVFKRDGREVEYDGEKVKRAISKAMSEVHSTIDIKCVGDIESHIRNNVNMTNVEDIQDMIELELMKKYPKVAKAYILYRDKRNQMRGKTWDMNELQRDIYSSKYQQDGESFDEFITRVSGGNKDVGKLIRNKDFSFGGRILAGRGLDRNITLSNCYVLPSPEDNIESIFDTAKYMARTYSFGGGVGIDISNLRPTGAKVNNAALTTSGPVSFMDLYDTTTSVIGQRGRRGALMISMSTEHEDIDDFIQSKIDTTKINHANISIRASDDFFKLDTLDKQNTLSMLAYHNWHSGEPGMLFWDRIKDWHLLSEHPDYKLECVNPCGEQPLPPFGNCLLGSINLSNFVNKPYTEDAYINQVRLEDAIRIAVEGLNEVLHEGIPLHPLKEQRDMANNFRQIGLGIMGLADMFVKMGIEYGSVESVDLSHTIGKIFRDVAIEKSVELTDKYGTYPKYDYDIISKSEYFKSIPEYLRELIKENGMANSHLLSIAPTGSISTLFGISGGIEPIFANSYTRTTKSLSGTGDVDYKVYTNVIEEMMNHKEITRESNLPEYCITSHDIKPWNRIEIQGAWQQYIDSAISSTINLKEDVTRDDIEDIYIQAHGYGLKGVTVFRDNCFRTGILNVDSKEEHKSKQECPECGGNLMMVEGCNTCQDCGWGQCSI